MERKRPVSPGFELTPELLVRQGRALRGLARAMLGDEHAAEDVVQETWVACLKHPGELPERVSAWLGTVTRRMALRRVRGEARRDARERYVAAHERVEAAQQRSLEHEEALRAVTQALAALEEPFKTALILRYHEERTPEEIARELDVPLATVKSRLARGLEKLRAALGRELGPDRRSHALALLAGVRIGTAGGSSLTIGGLALGVKTKVAAGLVLLGGLLYFLTSEGGRETTVARGAQAEPAERSDRPLAAPATGPGGDAEVAREEAPAREAVAAPESAPAALPFPSEASYTQRLVGRVLDSMDLPVFGARLLLAPAGLGFNLAATTDEEGRFVVEFASRRPALGCAWKIEVNGHELGPGWLEFQSGGTSELELALGSDVQQTVVYRAVMGSDFSLESVNFVSLSGGALSLLGGFDEVPEMAVGPDGRRHFIEHWAPGECPGASDATPDEQLQLGYGGAASIEFAMGSFVSPDEFIAVGMPGAAPGLARVSGIVRDAGGDPVPGAVVGYGTPGQTLVVQVPCDEQGAFTLEGVPPGEWRLRARGPAGEGRFEERVTLAADASLAWNPLLERGRELAGRLFLPEDKPAAGVEVELVSRGATRFQRRAQRTNEDGRFAFGGLDDGAYELFLRSADGTLPVRIAGPFRAPMDVGTLRLEPGELARHALCVRPLGPDGEDLPGAVLRLWHEASGLALERRGLDEEGLLVCGDLATGFYRVELGGLHGWRMLGTHWLEADLDLGTVAFPRPALLWLEPGETSSDEPRPPASLWRTHADVLTRLEENWSGRLARAALPGEYALCLAEGLGTRVLPFALESGRTTALELDGLNAPRPLPEPPSAGARSACLACHVDPRQ